MNISWVYADSCQLDATIDVEKIKNIGPTWGSWRTWRSCATDNVVCDDISKIRELMQRAFQAVCNFYIPNRHYRTLDCPKGFKVYDGNFELEVDHIEDIVAMHLASVGSDIVLLKGFDLSAPTFTEDPFENHKIRNYHGLIRSIISNNPDTQWVLVDHPADLDKAYQTLTNLTCDQMENVIQLLV